MKDLTPMTRDARHRMGTSRRGTLSPCLCGNLRG